MHVYYLMWMQLKSAPYSTQTKNSQCVNETYSCSSEFAKIVLVFKIYKAKAFVKSY